MSGCRGLAHLFLVDFNAQARLAVAVDIAVLVLEYGTVLQIVQQISAMIIVYSKALLLDSSRQ